MANDEEVRGGFDLHGSFGTSRGKLCATPRRPLIFLGICLTFLYFRGPKRALHLSVCPFYGCDSKQSAGLHPIWLLVFRENQRELWVGGLAAG